MPQSEHSPMYDSYGFDPSGLHRNGTLYDDAGYDAKGFFRPLVMNMLRFHRNGTLFDQDGYSYFGFDRDLRHRVTGSEFDSDGFNFEGYNTQGVNRRGFFGSNGYLHSDGTLSTHDPDGFNLMGFNEAGIHYLTGAELSDCGVNYLGFTEDGFNVGAYGIWRFDPITGRNLFGFDRSGQHRNGTRYSDLGFDARYFNRDGIHAFNGHPYDGSGFDRDGFNAEGLNAHGRDRQGYIRGSDFHPETRIHRVTATLLDPEGYDFDGYNEGGFARDGSHRPIPRQETMAIDLGNRRLHLMSSLQSSTSFSRDVERPFSVADDSIFQHLYSSNRANPSTRALADAERDALAILAEGLDHNIPNSSTLLNTTELRVEIPRSLTSVDDFLFEHLRNPSPYPPGSEYRVLTDEEREAFAMFGPGLGGQAPQGESVLTRALLQGSFFPELAEEIAQIERNSRRLRRPRSGDLGDLGAARRPLRDGREE